MAISYNGLGFYNLYNPPTSGSLLGSPTGTLTPATPAGYSSTYGGVPQVPDPRATAAAAIAANQAMIPGLEGLAGTINPFQQQQLLNAYRSSIRGYDGVTGLSSC